MAKRIATQNKIWVGGYDLSGDINAYGINRSRGEKEKTTFGNLTRVFVGGMKKIAFSHQGLRESTSEAQLDINLGINDNPVTIGPLTGADGEICYMLKANQSEYNIEAPIDELNAFSVSGVGNDLVRGTIMANLAAQAANANGTARQLGAVSASQSVYATLHVLAASGSSPTLDVTVNSDDNSGFTSGVQRIAFTQATGITSQWSSLAGAITDDWWRIQFTIGGSSPSFDFVVGIGIL